MTTSDARTSTRTAAAIQGRRADTNRRRERVVNAMSQAAASAAEISVAAIANAAGVDRTFIYRHRDLLEHLHALQAKAPNQRHGPTATPASLQADLLASHERAARLASHIQRLERRLSEALGEHVWRESGLGAPQDVEELHQRITQLTQQALDLQLHLDERDQDLAAARAANRDLMTRLNTTAQS